MCHPLGLPNLGERLGFNLVHKKCSPQIYKRGGGSGWVKSRVGGSKVGWVGLVQNTPTPVTNDAWLGWSFHVAMDTPRLGDAFRTSKSNGRSAGQSSKTPTGEWGSRPAVEVTEPWYSACWDPVLVGCCYVGHGCASLGLYGPVLGYLSPLPGNKITAFARSARAVRIQYKNIALIAFTPTICGQQQFRFD